MADPNESQKNPLMARWRKIFSENGFIIEDHIDEIDLLKSARHATLTNTKNLSLAILPTLDCNFRCVYCFEKRRPDVMGNEVEEALIRFVENKLERNGRLSVTWYGGRCAYLHHEQGKVQCIGGKHLPEENLLFYYFTKKNSRS